tara:strand:+ start:5755 stop:8679 length:2925 start_codon:yes stop_codon:yes gene_type:complete
MSNTIRIKRGSGSDPVANDMVLGEPVLRTDTAELFFKKDDGSVAKVSGGGGGPDFKYLELRNAANNGAASYPGNDFTLVSAGTTSPVTPVAANTLLVSVSGVIQKPNAGTSTSGITGFIVDGSRLKTATNLPAAPDFILYQESGGIGEPSDNTVSTDKIINGAVTTQKIANGTIVNEDISASASISGLKVAPSFGNQNIITTGTFASGNQTITSTAPSIQFTDSNSSPNYQIKVDLGAFAIKDASAGANRLTVDSSKIVSKLNHDFDAGIDVTGNITGTADLTIDTNTLHVDSTNNRVGIGTNSPSVLLDLESAAPTIKFTDSDASGTPESEISGAGGDLVLSADKDDEKASTQILGKIDGSTKLTIAENTTTIANNLDCSSGIDVTGNITVSGTVDGRDLATDGSKLDGIESGATADQTASDIKTLLNSSGLVNAQIDASAAIAGSKISPQFGSQNITATGNLSLSGGDITITSLSPTINLTDSNANDDFKIEVNSGSFKIIDATNSNDRFAIDSSGNITASGTFTTGSNVITGNITISGTVDGRDVASDGSKLDGIESGATADQSASEIKTAYESNSNTNAFTDALLSKLNGIAASATNVTNNNQLTNGAGYLTSVNTSNITNNAVSLDKLVDIAQNRIIGRIASGSGDATTLTPANVRSMINVEDGATADQTANEILTLLKTVDGSGSGLDADTLDGISIASLVRSDTADTINAALSINAGTSNATNDASLYVTATNNNDWGLKVDKYNGSATEFGQVIEVGSSATYALQVTGNGSEVFRIQGNGNVVLSGTVDGRDIAADGAKLDGIAAGATNVTNNNQITNGRGFTTFDGNYNSLSNRPTIPTNNNQLTNGAGYITASQVSSAPAAAKKWVVFSSSTIADDVGVSSITYHSTGQYTINFDGNMANTNYSVQGFAFRNGSGGRVIAHVDTYSTYTTSALRIMVSGAQNVGNVGLTTVNPNKVNIAIFGDT